MTLSVLMSVYKKETAFHLERSLESIWTNQTRKPDQIILVQDGPLTEDLYQVITKWEKILGDRLISPRNKENLGLTESLNKGLNYITTDLVARMDSDDISSSDRFQKQIDFLSAHPDIDVVSGSLQEFDSNNECICVRQYPTENIEKYICKASPLAHAASVLRMNIFREGKIKYDVRYPLNEDIALWFDILRKGYKISNIPDIVYFVDCDGGMFERRSRQKAKSEFLVYMRGIYSLNGFFTYRYIYPILRFIFRMMPTRIIAWIYGSALRQSFLRKQNS